MNTTMKITLFIMAAVAVICFGGCALNVYADSDKYTMGDREISGEVKDIDIDWTAGEVIISRHDFDYVSIRETCSDKLEDAKRVHSWLDGDVLRVKYCKSGESFFFTTPDKTLEIRIPKNIKLSDVKIDGSSCDSRIDGIEAEHIYADVSSGNVDVVDCSAQSIDVDSSSGNISIVQKGESDKINADSSSGKVRIEAEKVGKVRADTSSGNISVSADKADDVSIDSSSGDAKLSLGGVPSKAVIDTSSGDVTIYMPKDADFTAEVDTSSGEFFSELHMSRSGDTYTCGSGGKTISIDTSSGDISFMVRK